MITNQTHRSWIRTHSVLVPVELWDVDAIEANVEQEHLGHAAEKQVGELALGVLPAWQSSCGRGLESWHRNRSE